MLARLKLDGQNYDSWYTKIKYLLNKNNGLNFITREVVPKRGTNFAR